MATLKDVAKRAGVSAMTVSNVVNGREGKVSAATLARVQDAIEELGYVPSAAARSLGGTSRILALVYGAAPGRPALDSPYESVFVGVCEKEAREAGYALMLFGASCAQETVAQLRSWNVAGAVVMATMRMEPQEFLRRSGVPAVFVDAYEQAEAVDTVNIEDRTGARLAGHHLGRRGHRRVVFAGPDASVPGVVRERLIGLREGLGEHGGRVDDAHVLQTEVDFDEGRQVGRALPEGVSAVFASGDLLGLGVLAGLRDAGRAVPGEVSVVGFDGLPLSSYGEPALTTICQPVHAKAAAAIDFVLARVRDEHREVRRIVLPVEWQEGGTLGPAPHLR